MATRSATVRIRSTHQLEFADGLHAEPGTWTLIVDFTSPVVGDEISQPYTGNIRYNGVHVNGVPPYGQTAGDEPAAIPYTYTFQSCATSGEHGHLSCWRCRRLWRSSFVMV